MGRFIQLVMGPAGVGKSSYCKTIQDHCRASKRSMHVGNLDPAAEFFAYEASFDVRDLVDVDSAMDELGYGPNGGLLYCMEFLIQNSDWLRDELAMFAEDDYVILDCPGQVELYSHLPIMHDLAKMLQSWGYQVVSVYLLDALYALEPSKFISGCLLSLSCMLQLGTPHVNVITKCDIADKQQVEKILDSEGTLMISALDQQTAGKLKGLTQAMCSVVDDYMMVSFVMLDVTDEETIEEVMLRTDHAVQYGEDVEPREPMEFDQDEGDDGLDGGGWQGETAADRESQWMS